ncbi:hypothetical protein ACTWJ8_40430 (plasmid) [Streptomyces sp. SDT5-1]|uniref:hypothetical protein n=1 Tax=Streptomyces sp. SDT5-1 TaxID=3406418 RepID=UPI003FD55927
MRDRAHRIRTAARTTAPAAPPASGIPAANASGPALRPAVRLRSAAARPQLAPPGPYVSPLPPAA